MKIQLLRKGNNIEKGERILFNIVVEAKNKDEVNENNMKATVNINTFADLVLSNANNKNVVDKLVDEVNDINLLYPKYNIENKNTDLSPKDYTKSLVQKLLKDFDLEMNIIEE